MTYRSFITALMAAGFYGAGEGLDWPLLRQIGVAIALVFVLAWCWSRSSIARLGVRRDLAMTALSVGAVFAEETAVRSRSLLPKPWIEVRDRCAMPAHDASRVISLRSRGTMRWTTQSIAVKRGVFRMGPIFLRASDPFAIFSYERRVDFDKEVTVFPPVFDLQGFHLPGAQSSGGRQIDRRTPFTTAAVSSIRDYAAGDPFNRISWSSSARTGRLMVKEFDLDPTAEIWILADFDASQNVRPIRMAASNRNPDLSFAEAWLDSSEDFVAALGASVARKAIDGNRAVGYLTNASHRDYRPADSSERQFLQVTSSLAVATSDGDEPIEALLSREMRRFDRYRSPVVITASTELAWIDTLEYAALRGVQPTVIYIDPESFDPNCNSLAVRQRLATVPFDVYSIDYRTGIEASFDPVSSSMKQAYFHVN